MITNEAVLLVDRGLLTTVVFPQKRVVFVFSTLSNNHFSHLSFFTPAYLCCHTSALNFNIYILSRSVQHPNSSLLDVQHKNGFRRGRLERRGSRWIHISLVPIHTLSAGSNRHSRRLRCFDCRPCLENAKGKSILFHALPHRWNL